MPSTHSTSLASSSSSMPARLLTLVALASSLVAAQVYVPGPVDDTPGAAMVTMGAGADGYTTYVIEGVTLQENAASAIMTQYDAQGIPAVYNCVLGADAQATCTVSQANGVAYGYVEPITFFGETTGQLPAAFQTTTAPAGAADAAAATNTAVNSQMTPSSSSATYPTALTRTAGPAAGQAQETAANVFGAMNQTGAASSSTKVGMVLGSVLAAVAGAAMVFA